MGNKSPDDKSNKSPQCLTSRFRSYDGSAHTSEKLTATFSADLSVLITTNLRSLYQPLQQMFARPAYLHQPYVSSDHLFFCIFTILKESDITIWCRISVNTLAFRTHPRSIFRPTSQSAVGFGAWKPRFTLCLTRVLPPVATLLPTSIPCWETRGSVCRSVTCVVTYSRNHCTFQIAGLADRLSRV